MSDLRTKNDSVNRCHEYEKAIRVCVKQFEMFKRFGNSTRTIRQIVGGKTKPRKLKEILVEESDIAIDTLNAVLLGADFEDAAKDVRQALKSEKSQ